MPSLLKLVRWILDAVGDLSEFPLVVAPRCDPEVSMENVSLDGKGNGLPELLAAPAERGESPVDDGDISSDLHTPTKPHVLSCYRVIVASDFAQEPVTKVKGRRRRFE